MSLNLSKNVLCLRRRFCLNTIRFLSVSQTNCYQTVNRAKSFQNNRKSDNSVGHPYDQLFPWNSLAEFSRHLIENKVYFDGHLLAISKPWGIGTHKSSVNITDKNSHLSAMMYSGSSDYCLTDAIDHFCQILNVRRLKIIKTIDRFMSGIVLLSTDDTTEQKVIKAIRRAQAMESPAMTFLCVTKGWPVIDGNHIKERIGIKLLELDELGDHKQPIILSPEQLTNSMRRRRLPESDGMVVKTVLIELKALDINKTIGMSLVELSTNVLKWNLIQCYLAYKTSFVLGDVRFSRQVKHILGTPLSVRPDKINFTHDIEPLPPNICKKLMVRGNSHIPVHIHHKRIVLPLYLSKKDKKDLVIDSKTIPHYFDFTLNKLNLDTNCLK